MFFSHSHSSISLLSVLSVIIGVSEAATVPPTTISDLRTVDKDKSNHSKVIVYSRRQDKVPIDLVCECVRFYLCNSKDVVILPTSDHDNDQNQCQGEVEVCCAMRNETSSSTTNSLAVNTFSSPEPNTVKIITYGKSDDGAFDLQCRCTVFYLCNEQDWITLPTTSENQCLKSDVCCKIQVESQKVTQVDTGPSNATEAKIITYGRTDDGIFDLQCRCTVFYLCDVQDWITLPTASEDQCFTTDVCCKIHVESEPLMLDDTWSFNFNDTEPKLITYKSIDGLGSKDLQCRCTLFHECVSHDVVELPKTDKNQNQCSEGYVCCKESTIRESI